MVAIRRWLAFLGGVSIVSCMAGGPAFAQIRCGGDLADRTESARPVYIEPAKLPTDRQVRKKLDAAADCIKEERWADAVRLLQNILDSKEDMFVEPADKGGSRSSVRLVGARSEAERMLAALPRKGMEFYRLRYEADARQRLDEAKKRGDAQLLAETVRRYRHTAAGTEALALLAVYHLDRGRAITAARCFQGVIELPDEELPARTLFQAALAFRQAGDAERAERVWQRFADRIGSEGLRLGNRVAQLEELRKQFEAAPPETAASDWPTFRGGADRAGRMRAELPYLHPLWSAATADHPDSRAWIEHAVAQQRKDGSPVLSGSVPVVIGQRVIARSHGGIRALDLRTGRELWRAPSLLSLDSLMDHPGKKVQFNNWLWSYEGQQNLVYENTVLGTLSADSQRVYAVDDLPVPPHPQTMAAVKDMHRPLGPLAGAVYHNRLRALDLETGQTVWERGGRGDNADPLHDGFFLGPPLPLAGKLYGLFEKGGEIRLICLDAARGTLDWEQTLAIAHDPLLRDVGRRMRAASVAYADGVLICPTNAGAIVGVDLLSRALLWAHVYRDKTAVVAEQGLHHMPVVPEEVSASDPSALLTAWNLSAPIVADGKVICTAYDGEALSCLDPRTGELLWRIERAEDDLYVAAVSLGRVLIVGRSGCRALNLTDGAPIWQARTGAPFGLGAGSGRQYYLPLQRGGLCVLDIETGRVTASVDLRAGPASGNLVFAQGTMLAQGPAAVAAYPPLNEHLAALDARLTSPTQDGTALVERGRHRAGSGDLVGAVEDSRAALAAGLPDAAIPKVRGDLYEALSRLLERDYAAGSRYLEEYRALCDVPIPAGVYGKERTRLEKEQASRQINLQRLLARGHEQQGRLVEALKIYTQLHARPDAQELRVSWDDPALSTRLDVWAESRVGNLLARAAPEERKVLEAAIDAERSRARQRGELAQFVALYGDHCTGGREARQELAEHLMQDETPGQAAEAEMHLLRLLDRAVEPRITGRAIEALGRLLVRKGLLEDALPYYRRLSRDFGAVMVRDGKTGAELFRELGEDPRFLPLLHESLPLWVGRHLRFQEMAERTPANFLATPLCFEPEIDPAWAGTTFEPPPSVRRQKLLLDVPGSQIVVIETPSGQPRWKCHIDLSRLAPGLGRLYWPDMLGQTTARCRVRGHLAIVSLGSAVMAVDLLDRRIGWVRQMASPAYNPSSVYTQLGHEGDLEVHSLLSVFSRQAKAGPLTASSLAVLTRDGIQAVDPLTGGLLWARDDVPTQGDWFADGDLLRGSDAGRAVVCRAADGGGLAPAAPFGELSARATHWLGPTLLLTDVNDGELVQRRYDIRTGKDTWKLRYPARSLPVCDDSRRWGGAIDPAGNVSIVDALTGKELLRSKVNAKHLDKVTEVRLAADNERFYLLMSSPTPSEMQGPFPATAGYLHTVPVNGMVYAFDRTTGRVCWFDPVECQLLVMEQMEKLPILLFAAMRTANLRAPERQEVVVSSIEKRTGRFVVHEKALSPSGDVFHALLTNAAAGSVDLVRTNGTILRHTGR